MNDTNAQENQPLPSRSFFDRPGVQVDTIPVGPGVPLGIERVSNPESGSGAPMEPGARPTTMPPCPSFLEERLGLALPSERLNLAELGFVSRHHVPSCPAEEDVELEVQVGARFCARQPTPAAGTRGGRGGAGRHHRAGDRRLHGADCRAGRDPRQRAQGEHSQGLRRFRGRA